MSPGHLSPLDLDALLLPALASEERSRIEAHLAGCTLCQERRQAREERHAVFTRTTLPRGLERLRAPSRRRWLLALIPPALAAALWWRPHPAPRPEIGVKGPGALRVIVRRDGAVFEIADGARLSPGDAIRFVLAPAGREHLLIASVDGDGRANVYFPYRGDGSTRVDPARAVEAPSGSIVLDRAAGPERIFALWSTAPLASDQVRPLLEALGRAGAAAIRETSTLDLPGTLQASLFFEKGVPP